MPKIAGFVADLGSIPEGPLKIALEKAAKAREDKAADVAVSFLDFLSSTTQNTLNELRQLRKREREKKGLLDKQSRAFSYFTTTGNPLPYFATLPDWSKEDQTRHYCRLMGMEIPSKDDASWQIPDKFKAEDAVAE